jgi:hypothetical protein
MPNLARPYLTKQGQASPYQAMAYLTLLYSALAYLTTHYLTLPNLTPPSQNTPHLASASMGIEPLVYIVFHDIYQQDKQYCSKSHLDHNYPEDGRILQNI